MTATRPPYVMQFCSCPEGTYYGAQKMGTPPRCERCGFLPPERWVLDALVAALVARGVLTRYEIPDDREGSWHYATEGWASR